MERSKKTIKNRIETRLRVEVYKPTTTNRWRAVLYLTHSTSVLGYFTNVIYSPAVLLDVERYPGTGPVTMGHRSGVRGSDIPFDIVK